MRTILKTILSAGILLSLGIASAQQSNMELSVQRHSGDRLHYDVAFADGDIGKIVRVSVSLQTNAPETPNQPGASASFGGNCQKTNDPKTWTCDVVVPPSVRDGDYRLYDVSISSSEFGTNYEKEFHVPLVHIKNTSVFSPPSKVTVSERP
jgi:hypothetical protein